MKKLLLALAIFLAPSLSWAQCNGVFPASTYCGNVGASPNVPTPVPFGSIYPLSLPQYNFVIGNASNVGQATVLSGDCTYGASGIVCSNGSNITNNSIANSGLAQMVAFTLKGNNTASTATPVDMTVAQLKSMANLTINIQDPAYGAKCDGSTDDAAAITAAVAALTVGGTLAIDVTNCKVSSSVILNKSMTLQCGGASQNIAGNINAGANNVSPLVINSHNVTIDSCYINGPGTPNANTGIAIGTDATTITDGTCTNSSTTFTSTSQANFTSGDVGKYIKLTNCGTSGTSPLFTSISAFTNSTTVTLANAASCGGSCPASGMATAKYGVVYLNTAIRNTKVINFDKAVHLIDASQTRLDIFYAQGNTGLHIEDQLNPDLGNTYVNNSYILSIGTTSGHYAVEWNSGGEVFFSNTKLLNGQYGLYHNSTLGLTGGFNFVGGGIENCGTTGAFFSEAAQFNQVNISSTYINCGAPNLAFDSSGASVVNGATITGVTFGGGGGTAIDAGQVNYLTASGNTINTGGGNPAINSRSSCGSCLFGNNNIIGATLTYSNASTTTIIDDMIGIAFASLPSSLAVGSRIYVTNGTAGTSTCNGSGSGTLAVRVNSGTPAYRCF